MLTSTLMSKVFILLPGKHKMSGNSNNRSFLLWIGDNKNPIGTSRTSAEFGTGEMYAFISSLQLSAFEINSDNDT